MTEYDIMFINAITPLHNGSGEGTGIVDNSIKRERTTLFPEIQSMSIKGVLRDEYEEKNANPLFGPSTNKGSDHAGAISFGDGHILAFPVRSFKGCFVWVTSPLVLWRFYQRVNIADIKSFPNLQLLINKIHGGLSEAMICESGREEILVKNELDEEKLLLEENPIGCKNVSELQEMANEIGEIIFNKNEDSFMKEEFKKKLVVLDEDTFRYFITNATEIDSNIKIGDSGTTEDGSLRYTEYLPSETIIYSPLAFETSRKNLNMNAKEVKEKFVAIFPLIIQIGGYETTGKGIVKLVLAKEGNSYDDGQKP